MRAQRVSYQIKLQPNPHPQLEPCHGCQPLSFEPLPTSAPTRKKVRSHSPKVPCRPASASPP
jgi:hypothetical protein